MSEKLKQNKSLRVLLAASALLLGACSSERSADHTSPATSLEATVPQETLVYVPDVVEILEASVVDCESAREVARFRPWFIGEGTDSQLIDGFANGNDSLLYATRKGWYVSSQPDGTGYYLYGTTGNGSTNQPDREYAYIATIEPDDEVTHYSIGNLNLMIKPVSSLNEERQLEDYGYFGGVYPQTFKGDPDKPGLYTELTCGSNTKDQIVIPV